MFCAACVAQVGSHERRCAACHADLTRPGSVRLTNPHLLDPSPVAPAATSGEEALSNRDDADALTVDAPPVDDAPEPRQPPHEETPAPSVKAPAADEPPAGVVSETAPEDEPAVPAVATTAHASDYGMEASPEADGSPRATNTLSLWDHLGVDDVHEPSDPSALDALADDMGIASSRPLRFMAVVAVVVAALALMGVYSIWLVTNTTSLTITTTPPRPVSSTSAGADASAPASPESSPR